MSDKDKYYIDGYGTKRPKDVPFWDSAKGQLVKKAGNDLLTTGSFALGLLLPFGKLKILKTLSRVLNGAAIADFVTSDRVTTVDDDIKNGEYGKAAVTGLEALLTAGAIGSGFSKLPGVQKRAAMFARDGLVKDKMVVHRAIALPKGKNKPDLQYKRTGENVYEIPVAPNPPLIPNELRILLATDSQLYIGIFFKTSSDNLYGCALLINE